MVRKNNVNGLIVFCFLCFMILFGAVSCGPKTCTKPGCNMTREKNHTLCAVHLYEFYYPNRSKSSYSYPSTSSPYGTSKINGSSGSSSGSYSGNSTSDRTNTGSSSKTYSYDVDDYESPDDFADDAWDEFDDWEDAYEYYEDNY